MRVVVITGSTSGFGKLLVQEFLEAGDQVIATGRNLTKKLNIFQIEKNQYKAQLIVKDLDITSSEQRQAFCQYLQQTGTKVDILINNAGCGLFGPLEDLEEDQMRHQFEVNFFGLALLTRDLLPFLRRCRGQIFNFSSVLGVVAFPLASFYCASKFAVEGLSEALRFELQVHGVQMCLIEPGPYRTRFGDNLVWGARTTKAYQQQKLSYQNFRESLQAQTKERDPQEVARGVLKLSRRSSLPLRKAFGREAKMTLTLRRFLPTSWYLWLASLYFQRKLK